MQEDASSEFAQWRSEQNNTPDLVQEDGLFFDYIQGLNEGSILELKDIVDFSQFPDPLAQQHGNGLIGPKQEHHSPVFQPPSTPASSLPPIQIAPAPQPMHPPTSPPSDCSPDQVPIMQLTLYHKPRGSGGAWMPIPDNGRIRVTRGKGKKLRIRVQCNFTFDWSELDVSLVDLVSGADARSDFSIDPKKSTLQGGVAEIEVNLVKICKGLQFAVTLQSKHGWRCNGRTIRFITHNNGKDRLKYSAEDSPISSPLTSPDPTQTPQSPDTDTPLSPSTSPPAFMQDVTGATKKRRLDSDETSGGSENTHVVNGPLHVKGVVRAQGFIQYSDLRLKTNVEDLMDAINIVQKLQGKTYEWKTDEATNAVLQTQDDNNSSAGGKRVIGLIAQEVQRVVPEVVSVDPLTGYLSVSYAELVPILIEALKHHLKDYEKDKAEMKKEIEDIRNTLGNLVLAKENSGEDIQQKASDDEGDEEGPGKEDGPADTNANPDSPIGTAPASPQTPLDAIRERTNNFSLPMTFEEVERLTKWANDNDLRLGHVIRKNIKEARRRRRQEKGDKKGGWGRKYHRKWHRRRADDDEMDPEQQLHRDLVLDPIRLQASVLNFGRRVFVAANKHRAKLAAVLFWQRGEIENLAPVVVKDEDKDKASIETFEIKDRGNCRRRSWVMLGMRSPSDEGYNGTYRVQVKLVGGSAAQLHQSKAVIAVFDFRTPGVQPLWMMSGAANGAAGDTWLVGTFVVDSNAMRWQSKPNAVVQNVPSDWDTTSSSSSQQEDGNATPSSSSASSSASPSSSAQGPRRVFLRSKYGRYLSATPEGKVICRSGGKDSERTVPHFCETWEVEFDKSGCITLRSYFGKYLSAIPRCHDTPPRPAAEYGESGLRLAADRELVGERGWERFGCILDDAQSTLILISYDAKYVYPTPDGRLTAASSLNTDAAASGGASSSSSSSASASASASPASNAAAEGNACAKERLTSSQEARKRDEEEELRGTSAFFELMSQGGKAVLAQEMEKERKQKESSVLSLSSSTTTTTTATPVAELHSSMDFFRHLSEGVKLDEPIDLSATADFFEYLSQGAKSVAKNEASAAAKQASPAPAPAAPADNKSTAEEPSSMRQSYGMSFPFRLPTDEEKWTMEVAPSREAQQAQQAQEIMQKLRLHSASPSNNTAQS